MEELKRVYGKYSIPREITSLFKLEAELQEDGRSLADVWLRLEKRNFRYSITPPDLITFISTGGDGIHFGFLTDFGQVKNLEEAYIVCVSPTDDPPLKIVARNLKDFLNLTYTLKLAESLDYIHRYQSEEAFLRELNEDMLQGEFSRRAKPIMEMLGERFKLQAIDHIFAHIDRVREERRQMLALETLDGIGVIEQDGAPVAPRRHDFTQPKDIKRIRDHLRNASYVEKLGFFRDANYTYILAEGYDMDIKQLILEEMTQMGLEDEITRLTLAPF